MGTVPEGGWGGVSTGTRHGPLAGRRAGAAGSQWAQCGKQLRVVPWPPWSQGRGTGDKYLGVNYGVGGKGPSCMKPGQVLPFDAQGLPGVGGASGTPGGGGGVHDDRRRRDLNTGRGAGREGGGGCEDGLLS
eukprot:763179-Hanusia_phi.AAC.8